MFCGLLVCFLTCITPEVTALKYLLQVSQSCVKVSQIAHKISNVYIFAHLLFSKEHAQVSSVSWCFALIHKCILEKYFITFKEKPEDGLHDSKIGNHTC